MNLKSSLALNLKASRGGDTSALERKRVSQVEETAQVRGGKQVVFVISTLVLGCRAQGWE